MEDQRPNMSECSLPPALDDLVLIAAMDGEADADAVAHLRVCRSCASRARDFAELQGQLRQRLYRMFCPSSDDLAAFQQGLLGRSQRASVAEHLAGCPHCTRELRMLTAALGPPSDLRLPLVPRLRRIVARLLAPSPLPPLAAFSGAMRGGPGGGHYAYQAEDVQIMLDITPVPQRPGRLAVLGLLVSDDSPDHLRGATALLLSGETVVRNSGLDELGHFTLDNLAPGDYDLLVRLHDREVVIEALNL